MRARRELGATWTLLGGEVRLHGASTDRIDLEASWTDLIDDPAAGGPSVPRAEARAAPRPLATGPPRAGRRRRATVRRGAGGTVRRGRRPARARRRSGMAGRPTVHVGPRAAQHEAPARHVHGDGDVTLPRVLPAGARRRARRADAPVGAGRRRRAELVAPPPPDLRYAVPLFGWERREDGRTRTTTAPRWRAAPVPRAAVAGVGRGRAARCRAVEGVDPGVPATSPRRASRHHVGVRSGVAGAFRRRHRRR